MGCIRQSRRTIEREISRQELTLKDAQVLAFWRCLPMNLSVALTQGLVELALTRSHQEEPTPAEELAPLFLTIASLKGLTRQRTVSQIAGQAL